MILMALDHTRTFFLGLGVNPTDLGQTTPALFFTRWITHFCAPSFILLAGASAFLFGVGKDISIRRRFLWTRGVWLILLELTIVKFGWAPEPFYAFTILQVIWALGWSMVLLAPFSSLPPRLLALLGAVMILSHHVLDSISSNDLGPLAFLWAMIHERQKFEPIPGHTIFVVYPLIPWIGVMALGFGLGQLYLKTSRVRSILLQKLGLGLCLAFIILRTINLYGNPTPWSIQPQLIFSILSFLNCQKYPPSLVYLLMTLGPVLLLLSLLERHRSWGGFGQTLMIFGRVPLFFYIAHLYLLRITSFVLAYMRWGNTAFQPPPDGHLGNPEYPLWAVYLIFIVAILVLFPLCKAYANFKTLKSSQYRWLRYF